MLHENAVITPLLPDNKPGERIWGLWPTIGFTLVVLMVFFIVQTLVIAIPAIVIGISHAGQGAVQAPEDLIQMVMDELNARLGLLQSIATIVSGIIGTGMIVIFVRARKGASIAEYLGLRKISIKTLAVTVGSIIAYIVVADIIQMLVGSESNNQIINDVYDTSVWPPLFWIAVIVFAPLFEEALFRGFMFQGLRQSSLGVYGAVMITAFVWSLLHGLQYDIGGIVWIFALGVVMGIVRWRTKTIWSTFIMHAIVNLVATIALATNWNI